MSLPRETRSSRRRCRRLAAVGREEQKTSGHIPTGDLGGGVVGASWQEDRDD